MEHFEEQWLGLEMMLKERFGKVPDMEAMLFLIGINELGSRPHGNFTKEQKQDLMHIAVCTLLETLGYYEYIGRDEEGWPHFERVTTVSIEGARDQERILKECIIRYFEKI